MYSVYCSRKKAYKPETFLIQIIISLTAIGFESGLNFSGNHCNTFVFFTAFNELLPDLNYTLSTAGIK